jgi:hypothetical protein
MTKKHQKTVSDKRELNKKKEATVTTYSAISIRSEVAVLFRDYSKRFEQPHSEVLLRMMVFLKRNDLDPFGDSVEKIVREIKSINRMVSKKTDHLIAIIKNMERTSIQPIYEMTLALYIAHVNAEEKKKPRSISRKRNEESFTIPKPETVPKYEHDMLKGDYGDYKIRCHKLLEKVEKVEPLLGKPYLRVNMDIREFDNLKAALK